MSRIPSLVGGCLALALLGPGAAGCGVRGTAESLAPPERQPAEVRHDAEAAIAPASGEIRPTTGLAFRADGRTWNFMEVDLGIPAAGSVEAERAERRSRLEGAARGAGVGLLSGAVGGAIGATLADILTASSCARDELLCFSTTEWALFGAYFGAIYGLAGGAVIGFLFPNFP